MIVDTAVHYVLPPTPDRPYASDGTIPGEILSVESAVAAAAAAGIDAIVQMAPSVTGWDNGYSLEGVRRFPGRVLGVFARFDPVSPGIEGRLAALTEEPGVLGVRVLYRAGTPSARWLIDGALDPFLAIAERTNVAVASYPADPGALRAAARRFPGVRFIAEHATLPKREGGRDPFERWAEVLDLAQEPNVWTQVSFFPEAAPAGERFPYPTSRRRFRELYERAGAKSLIWGAHYPRVKETCTYREALAFVAEAEFVAPQDRAAILGDNFVAAFVAPR